MPSANSESVTSKQSRLITKVLSPALRLWLRSQVSQVSQLEVNIFGGDRQILSGYIPKVAIFALNAVYQGLCITQIQLVAENIRINVGGILKGKSLQLLQPVPVFGELVLQESDLNASLPSALLSNALTDLLRLLLSQDCPNLEQINWDKITIESDQLILAATLTPELNPRRVEIRTYLKLASCHELLLEDIQIRAQDGSLLGNKNSFCQDLGPEVDIQELTLSPRLLVCRGRVNVIPAE
jgi:hypothetical protein